MKSLLRITLLFALAGPAILLSSCGPDTSYDHTVRANFADTALHVLDKIERVHDVNRLNVGEVTPGVDVDQLLSYAHSDAEKDVAKKLGDLITIVLAQSDEYSGCDAKIKAALLSRNWPDTFYPECR